jgi:hypothetical protein
VARSVLLFAPKSCSATREVFKNQLLQAVDLVTEGRYLITVFEAPSDWESHLPIESLVIGGTLGGIQNRNNDWEFFGNGVIRTYSARTLRYSKAFQWVIVRRVGEKPYTRRPSLSSTILKRNAIPVADKVFTRDVANNVWHLVNDRLNERLISRFSALLTWQDEEFVVLEGGKATSVKDRTALSLKEDLVGVPNKTPYLWDSGDVLF